MRKPILKSDGGFTLISVLMEGVIILVAFIGLYIGIVYAEATLVDNYHNRVAILHASGELDYQMLQIEIYSEPDRFLTRTVTLDRDGNHRLNGTMTMNDWSDTDSSTGFASMMYYAVEVTVTWKNPSDNETRKITLREDYFREI